MSEWRFAADMKTAHGLVGGASEGVVGKNSHLGNPPFRSGDDGAKPRLLRTRGQTRPTSLLDPG